MWKLLRLYWGSQPAIGPRCGRPINNKFLNLSRYSYGPKKSRRRISTSIQQKLERLRTISLPSNSELLVISLRQTSSSNNYFSPRTIRVDFYTHSSNLTKSKYNKISCIQILSRFTQLQLYSGRLQGRGDQVDTNFTSGAPCKIWEGKKCPKFSAIFDNFRIWSRISPERINISKIGKVLDQLHFIPY